MDCDPGLRQHSHLGAPSRALRGLPPLARLPTVAATVGGLTQLAVEGGCIRAIPLRLQVRRILLLAVHAVGALPPTRTSCPPRVAVLH